MNIRPQLICIIGAIKKFSSGYERGFALIEMLVATGLFAIIILAATGIFQTVIEAQRSAIASQNTQESMRFALEVIGKEIRMAVKSESDCWAGATKKIYNVENINADEDKLYIKNKDGICVSYFVNNDRLEIDRGGETLAITPDEIKVSNLQFDIIDDNIGAFRSVQPKATLKMKVEMITTKTMHQQAMILQTTISSRVYE